MNKGRWKSAISDLMNQDPAEGGLGLSQGIRHQEIVRERLIKVLLGAVSSHISSGTNAHLSFAQAVDNTIEAVIENAQKDGLDLDGELIDQLTSVAANLHAIRVKWKEIESLLNQPQQ